MLRPMMEGQGVDVSDLINYPNIIEYSPDLAEGYNQYEYSFARINTRMLNISWEKKQNSCTIAMLTPYLPTDAFWGFFMSSLKDEYASLISSADIETKISNLFNEWLSSYPINEWDPEQAGEDFADESWHKRRPRPN